jgi:hypothetical protein
MPHVVALFHPHPVHQIKKEEMKTELNPEDKVVEDKKTLEKARLPMPRSSAHHRVILPVGSEIGRGPAGAAGTVAAANKIKVQTGEGRVAVKQVEAGQIMSAKPGGQGGAAAVGHATSSRHPSG